MNMRIGLIIADFELHYTTSFLSTARRKYDVDFTSSNVDSIVENLNELRNKVENNICNDVHVGFEITLEHVIHTQELIEKITSRYCELFGRLPINPIHKKIYTINDKLRQAESPTTREMAKEVVMEILNPKVEKLSKAEKLKIDAAAVSKERALKQIKTNSKKR
jgi:leucyl-tRNA synthetase